MSLIEELQKDALRFQINIEKLAVSIYGEVPDIDIDDVLTTAFEGGSNYWINEVKVVDGDYKGKGFASEVVSRGGELILVVDNENDITVNKYKMIDGFRRYQERYGKKFDMEQHDANDADNLLQLAVFGELTFG